MTETTTKAMIADNLHFNLGFSKAECNEFISTVLEEISQSLVGGEEVKLTSFGTFKVREKKARYGRNPRTKEEYPISARKVVTFIPSSGLKEKVNGD